MGWLWCEGRTWHARRGQGIHRGVLLTMCASCMTACAARADRALERRAASHPAAQVGLNLSNREPTTCVDALIEAAAAAAASGASAAGGDRGAAGSQQQPQQMPPEPVGRERLLAGILSRLEPMLEQLAADGFGPFEAEYCRHWLHSDQQVRGWAEHAALAAEVSGWAVCCMLHPAESQAGAWPGLAAWPSLPCYACAPCFPEVCSNAAGMLRLCPAL